MIKIMCMDRLRLDMWITWVDRLLDSLVDRLLNSLVDRLLDRCKAKQIKKIQIDNRYSEKKVGI